MRTDGVANSDTFSSIDFAPINLSEIGHSMAAAAEPIGVDSSPEGSAKQGGHAIFRSCFHVALRFATSSDNTTSVSA